MAFGASSVFLTSSTIVDLWSASICSARLEIESGLFSLSATPKSSFLTGDSILKDSMAEAACSSK